MKKTIFKLLGTGFVAASVFGFVSCGESIDYDARTDTVYSLDAPSVTAKAYPGVNYISWEPVTSAQGYKLYRVKDGVTSVARTLTSDVTCYADVASSNNVLSDGKEYKYIVEAISGTDPAVERTVYAKNSKGSASVKAVVPTAGSPAISAEPTGSGKDFIKKYYEKLVTKASENVKLSISDGYFYAEYPATAGFKYGLAVVPKGEYAALGDSVAETATIENYKEDYKAEVKKAAAGSSEVEILLTVASVSELYKSVVVKLGSLTPDVIGESSQIRDAVARRDDSDRNKVIVVWTPAKLSATNDYSPAGNFRVYRSSAIDPTWTALSAEVKETEPVSDGAGGFAKFYYITDTEENNSYLYSYHIVHTDGTKFGSSIDCVLYGVKDTTNGTAPSVTKYVGGTDGLENDIKIVSTRGDKNQTLALSYVKLTYGRSMYYSEKYALSAFTPLTLENYDGYEDSYITYIKDLEPGDYCIKLVTSEEGKLDSIKTVNVTVNSAEVDVTNLSVTYDDVTGKVTVKEEIAKDSKLDSVANYNYTLYKVETTTSADYLDYVTVSTTEVSDVALEYGADTTYCSKVIEAKKSTATGVDTQFYVEKALASDSSVYAKVSE